MPQEEHFSIAVDHAAFEHNVAATCMRLYHCLTHRVSICRFAVAWYPIYRIPDAPLAAKFLTYHSLCPVPSCQTYFGVGNVSAASSSNSASSPLCLPILGLKLAEQKGEPWLEMYNQSSAARREWEVRLRLLADPVRTFPRRLPVLVLPCVAHI